jgi:glucose/arabinose dehydrogenase
MRIDRTSSRSGRARRTPFGRGAVRALAHAVLVAALSALAPGGSHAATQLPFGFADSLVRGALDFPVGMAFLPDGRLLFVEQKTARIRLIVQGALSTIDPVATIPSVQTSGNEQGLLGIAVDPGWPARPYLYVHCDDSALGTIRISRYQAAGDLGFTGDGHLTVDPLTRFDLLADIPDNAPNHNGGTLRFGIDGMLYASLGEDAQPCLAQDTVSFRGVILRLDVNQLPPGSGGPAAKSLLVPPTGNPFSSHPDANAKLVWAIGLRNPFRFHVDPADGTLFIADVGETRWEEIDHAMSGGRDFGWPVYEGPVPYSSCPGAVRGDDPIYAFDRTGSTAAVISGGIYRHAGNGAFPAAYQGDYFLSDYYLGFLRRLDGSAATWQLAAPVAGQPSATDWGRGFEGVSDYLTGDDGALWYCRQSIGFQPHTGEIRRIVVIPEDTLLVTPPVDSAFAFAPPHPSPAHAAVTLDFRLPNSAPASLVIFDVRGRRVRDFGPIIGAGPHTIVWNGLDDEGSRVGAGLYLARLIVGGRSRERRIPLLR